MTATYSFLQTAGCLLFLLSTPETGLVTLLITSRICPYLHCRVAKGTKVFVWGLNTPRSRISENNIPRWISLAWLFSVEWHTFPVHFPPLDWMTTFFFFLVYQQQLPSQRKQYFFWIITTALGKLELDTELQPSCKVSVWSRDKELLWYGSPEIHTRGLSPSINSTLLFLQDSCIIYGPPPLQIIICCVVFTPKI